MLTICCCNESAHDLSINRPEFPVHKSTHQGVVPGRCPPDRRATGDVRGQHDLRSGARL